MSTLWHPLTCKMLSFQYHRYQSIAMAMLSVIPFFYPPRTQGDKELNLVKWGTRDIFRLFVKCRLRGEPEQPRSYCSFEIHDDENQTFSTRRNSRLVQINLNTVRYNPISCNSTRIRSGCLYELVGLSLYSSTTAVFEQFPCWEDISIYTCRIYIYIHIGYIYS